MKIVAKPDNEAEALAIESLLRDSDIECLVRSFHDTAYDGIYQAQYGWGTISVHERDYDQAKMIVLKWREAAPDVTNCFSGDFATHNPVIPNPSRLSFVVFVKNIAPYLIIPSILLNLFFIATELGIIGSKYERIYSQYDRDNIVYAKVDWRNNEYSPYYFASLAKDQTLMQESYDTNDDGRTDLFTTFIEGSMSTSTDSDYDGFFEVSKTVFSNGSSVTYYDNDENGVYERESIILKNQGELFQVTNSNTNGFPLEITGRDGMKLDLSVLSDISKKLQIR